MASSSIDAVAGPSSLPLLPSTPDRQKRRIQETDSEDEGHWGDSSDDDDDSQPIGYLILIRHPQTMANAAHLLQGCTDSPLSPLGELQMNALAQWLVEEATIRLEATQQADPIASSSRQTSRQTKSRGWGWPETIVHSPLGRTTRLAEEIERRFRQTIAPTPNIESIGSPRNSNAQVSGQLDIDGLGSTESSTEAPSLTSIPSTSRLRYPPTPTLHPSADLREKSFGPSESTHRGVHPGPPFPVAPPTLKRESNEAFLKRVERGGRFWLTRLAERGRDHRDRRRNRKEDNTLEKTDVKGETDDEALDEVTLDHVRSTAPTMLLVTHGLWLSAFLKLFVRTSLPVDQTIPFASNTGMYLLDLYRVRSPQQSIAGSSRLSSTGRATFTLNLSQPNSSDSNDTVPRRTQPIGYRLNLVQANYTPHLVGPALSASSGRSSKKVENDSKQRKLDSFFTKPRT